MRWTASGQRVDSLVDNGSIGARVDRGTVFPRNSETHAKSLLYIGLIIKGVDSERILEMYGKHCPPVHRAATRQKAGA